MIFRKSTALRRGMGMILPKSFCDLKISANQLELIKLCQRTQVSLFKNQKLSTGTSKIRILKTAEF